MIIDTYVFTDAFGGGKLMKFVLYKGLSNEGGDICIYRIAGYVGNVDESPLEAPWTLGNIINITTPNMTGSLCVAQLLHGNRLACVNSIDKIEIHAKPIDTLPPQAFLDWREAGERLVASGQVQIGSESRTVPPYFYRMEVHGTSFEFGAATLVELLALMRAKGVSMDDDNSLCIKLCDDGSIDIHGYESPLFLAWAKRHGKQIHIQLLDAKDEECINSMWWLKNPEPHIVEPSK